MEEGRQEWKTMVALGKSSGLVCLGIGYLEGRADKTGQIGVSDSLMNFELLANTVYWHSCTTRLAFCKYMECLRLG